MNLKSTGMVLLTPSQKMVLPGCMCYCHSILNFLGSIIIIKDRLDAMLKLLCSEEINSDDPGTVVCMRECA